MYLKPHKTILLLVVLFAVQFTLAVIRLVTLDHQLMPAANPRKKTKPREQMRSLGFSALAALAPPRAYASALHHASGPALLVISCPHPSRSPRVNAAPYPKST